MRSRLIYPCCVFTLAALLFYEAAGFSIRSEVLGRCVQVQDGRPRARVVLEQCSPGLALQEWQWLPESHALSSLHSGECLSAVRGRGVHHAVRLGLHPCSVDPGSEEGGGVGVAEEGSRESQAWACTKEGHLTLQGKGLHLSTRQDSAKVFLSKEPGQAGEWRTIGNHSICGEKDSHRHGYHHHHHHHRLHRHSESMRTADSAPSVSSATITNSQQQPMDQGGADSDTTDRHPGRELSPLSERESTLTSEGPTVAFFTMDYGFGWKVTMLVLSSLALVLGTVILILSIYNNRKKKVVCVLKSYTPTGDVSQPGSPAASERAPLTKHPMRPARSPSLQRGEILIEWKDGTVTPLFDSFLTD